MVFAAFGWQLFPDGPLANYIITGLVVAYLCAWLARPPSIVGAVIGGTVVDGTVTWTKRSDNCITSWATEGNL
jgi:hypothetical protein